MEIRQIIENQLVQFVFAEEGDENWEVSVTALISGDKALLIDTGYKENAKVLKSWFLHKGIQVSFILLSHYHPDHCQGAYLFDNVTLACSENFEQNYKACSERWDPSTDYKIPGQLLKEGSRLDFGNFEIEVTKLQGHSSCSLGIMINKKFLHIGDVIMKDKRGNLTLPYISEDGNIKEYRNSLYKLNSLRAEKLLLSHGYPTEYSETKEVVNRIDGYLQSLEQINEANEDAIDLSSWGLPKLHRLNIKNVDRLR